MFCTKCGTKLEETAAFCHNCGTAAAASQTSKEETATAEFASADSASDYIDSDVRSLIGAEKEAYYTAKFADMKRNNHGVSWNWCAFLFGPAWMIYRKMYVYGALYWLASILIIDSIFILDIIASAAVGVYGNWMYMTSLEKCAVDAKAMAEPAKSQFIEKNGGTSATAVLVGMGVVFTLSFVGNLLWGGFFG